MHVYESSYISSACERGVWGGQGLSREQTEQWRCTITEEVLGTDMKKHFVILTTFLVRPACLPTSPEMLVQAIRHRHRQSHTSENALSPQLLAARQCEHASLHTRAFSHHMALQYIIMQAASKCQLGGSSVELQPAESVGASWLDLKPENRTLACQVGPLLPPCLLQSALILHTPFLCLCQFQHRQLAWQAVKKQ